MKSSNDQYVASFETFLASEKRVARNTFLAYKKDIVQLLEYLETQKTTLKNCSSKHLKQFLKVFKKQGLSSKTLSRKVSSMKLFFGFLADNHGFANHAQNLIFPKIDKSLPTYLTEEEVYRLLDTTDQDTTYRGIRNKVMLYLLYSTGMRVTELVEMTIDRIHFDSGFVSIVGKGNKERMVPVPRKILFLINQYLDTVYEKLVPAKVLQQGHINYLFPSCYQGKVKPLSRQLLWSILKKTLYNSGITKNISPHSLRHSLATHLLKNGANIRSLQLFLGHEQLTTVQIYTHLENKQLREIYDKKHPRAKG
jgi:integrase/recombinase XerD